MHIAFIGQRGIPATYGGIEHHVEELGSRLVARGHRVTVYTRGNYTDARVRDHRGMLVRYVPTVGTKRLEALVHSGLSTAVAMLPGAESADILHYHAIGPSMFTPLPRALTRKRIVLTIHGLDYERDKWGPGAKAALRTAGWVSAHVPHATISVSRNIVEYYRQRYHRRVHYVPNGVLAPVRRPPHEIAARWGLQGGDYVLFLGRLVPEKAPDLLLRAFAGVPGSTRLVVAGGSSFTDDYVRSLEELATRDSRVLLTGPVYGDVRDELYSNAAAFVLPSKLEGLPLTLLEAASYGLPLVASAIPAHVEVIQSDQPGGRLVAPGDAAELSRVLDRVLADAAGERAGAARLSSRITREYDWDAATDSTESLYRDVLASGRSSAPVLQYRPAVLPWRARRGARVRDAD